MDKTIEMLLAEQRDVIYQAIIDTPSPEQMDWVHKLVFEHAKITFAKLAIQTRVLPDSCE